MSTSPIRTSLLAAAVLAAAGLTACSKSVPTSVLLHVQAAPGLPTLDAAKLTVYQDSGVVVSGRRLPKQGSPELPSTVLLMPPADSGELRIQVLGEAGGAVVGEGVTRVTVVRGSQVEATVTVAPGRLPDRDGDGVPDEIDRCPDDPNASQSPCASDAGPDGQRDSGVDDSGVDDDLALVVDQQLTDQQPLDLVSPDQDCDKDKDGHRSSSCGGSDCDDSSAKAYPGGTEGPANNANCSDGLDNDCDGAKDSADNDCAPCQSNADCDDQSSCTTDTCSGGVCKHAAANEGKPCSANKCFSGGKCKAGQCDGKAKVCQPPANSCKAAACDPVTGCYTKDLPDGSNCSDGDPCTTGEACKAGSCVDPGAVLSCYINGTCHADGTTQGSCRSCAVSSSKTAWTIDSGSCYINGTCRSSGYNHNSCQECIPSQSQTSWSISSGTCYIGGSCYSSGAAGSGCFVCNPTASKTGWTAKPSCGIVLVALNHGYTGNLGGLSGANSKCVAQASAAGLTGTFKALLSTTIQSAKGIMPSTKASGQVYNTKGQQLYSSWNAMFTPSTWATGTTIYAFDGRLVDEGTGASPDWNDADAWHGSTSTGTVRIGYTCGDWTVTTGSGSVGEVDLNTFLTTIETRACSLNLAVLCVRIPN
jgi:hypothetical protein